MYVNVVLEICVFRTALLFTDPFIFLHFIYPAVIYRVYHNGYQCIILPQAEVSTERWILLSDSLITLHLCAMSCRILFCTVLYMWSQGLTSTQPWLYMNCSIKPLVSFWIQTTF